VSLAGVPAEALAERLRILWLGNAEDYEVSIAAAQGVRPRRHRHGVRKAAHGFAVHETKNHPDWERDVVWPFALKAGSGDFALAQRHCRTAYRREASVLNSFAAASIAVFLFGASTVPSQMALAATL